jgi:hypothetical protein
MKPRNRRKRDWVKRLRAMPPDVAPKSNSAMGAGGEIIANFTLAQNMEAFDKLPRAVRALLHESAYNWSAAKVRQKMAEDGWLPAGLVKLITEIDKIELEKGRRAALQEIYRRHP